MLIGPMMIAIIFDADSQFGIRQIQRYRTAIIRGNVRNGVIRDERLKAMRIKAQSELCLLRGRAAGDHQAKRFAARFTPTEPFYGNKITQLCESRRLMPDA